MLLTSIVRFFDVPDHARMARVCRILNTSCKSPTAWEVLRITPFDSWTFWDRYPDVLQQFAHTRPRVLHLSTHTYSEAMDAKSARAVRNMLHHVQVLNINYTALLDVHYFCLPALQDITLYWEHNHLHEDDFFSYLVSRLQKCKRLRVVHVYGLPVAVTTLPAWKNFLRLPIETLHLFGLQQHSRFPPMTLPSVHELGLCDFGAGSLQTAVMACPSVSDLQIQRTSFTDDDFGSLLKLPLTNLSLCTPQLTARMFTTMRTFALRELMFYNVQTVRSDDAELGFANFTHLESLSLENCCATLQRAVLHLPFPARVKELQWDCARPHDVRTIAHKDFPLLITLIMPALTALRLGSRCELGDLDLLHMTKHLTALRTLNIAAITSPWATFMPPTGCAIAQLKHLQFVSLHIGHFADFKGMLLTSAGFRSLETFHALYREETDRPLSELLQQTYKTTACQVFIVHETENDSDSDSDTEDL